MRRIRDLREDNDYNQTDIAELLGCNQSSYSDYETGRSDIPTQRLIKLCEFYNVSADYILGLTDKPGRKKCNEVVPINVRLKELRKAHKLTQAQLGENLNFSQRICSDYEAGTYDISTETLIALAKFYRVSTDCVLGISDR